MKNSVILIESIVFYAFYGLKYLPLIAILVLLHYMAGVFFDKKRGSKLAKTILMLIIISDVVILLSFKYFGALYDLIEKITGEGLINIEFLDVMPIGLSYYLFKLISYVIDVYKGKTECEKNIVKFSAYAMFFSQMFVGPIARYEDVKDYFCWDNNKKEFEKNELSLNTEIYEEKAPNRIKACYLEEGAKEIIVGLSKKVILADSLALLWLDIVSDNGIMFKNASVSLTWLAIIAFSLQLYLDFSGFSQISNGISLLYGIRVKPNFNLPYIANSISDFWRRWHISLSTWFRDYVYIPLGGNRKGLFRQFLNIMIVWGATGIWHGSTSNYLIWGIYYGILLILEKVTIERFHIVTQKETNISDNLPRSKTWDRVKASFYKVFTLLVVVVGWGIFSATGEYYSVSELFRRLFHIDGSFISGAEIYYIANYWVIILISVIASSSLSEYLCKKLSGYKLLNTVTCILLFVLSFLFIIGGTSQAAMYAGF